ncbi:threonine-rich protein [Eurosta solidaginis]|uniref:threonine-rich protein n=1 Tax=Eurosta solidaginis TaxID=178769 RepID=UPI003530E97D
MWRISITIFVVFMAGSDVNAACNICNPNNGAACASNTTFRLCFNGVPQNPVYTCPNAGDVCTALGLICADPQSNSHVKADCGNTAQCGLCQGVNDGAYTCTSQNTFGMCMGGQLTTVIATCPTNEICLTSQANGGISPCVNTCLRDPNNMCDIASSTTATPTTATTPTNATTTTTPTSLLTSSSGTTSTVTATSPSTPTSSTGFTASAEDSICASRTQVGRYPYPNDTACTTYVYCYLDRSTNRLAGRAMSCPNGKYFNQSINSCQAALPAGCV